MEEPINDMASRVQAACKSLALYGGNDANQSKALQSTIPCSNMLYKMVTN